MSEERYTRVPHAYGRVIRQIISPTAYSILFSFVDQYYGWNIPHDLGITMSYKQLIKEINNTDIHKISSCLKELKTYKLIHDWYIPKKLSIYQLNFETLEQINLLIEKHNNNYDRVVKEILESTAQYTVDISKSTAQYTVDISKSTAQCALPIPKIYCAMRTVLNKRSLKKDLKEIKTDTNVSNKEKELTNVSVKKSEEVPLDINEFNHVQKYLIAKQHLINEKRQYSIRNKTLYLPPTEEEVNNYIN